MSGTSDYDSGNSYSGRYCPLCGEWIPPGTGVHYCHKSESVEYTEDNNEPDYGWHYGLLWEDATMKRIAAALERIADALEKLAK